VRARADLLERLQRGLLREGVPLAWLVDVGVDHPAFAGSQALYLRAPAAFAGDLLFRLEAPVSAAEWEAFGVEGDAPATRGLAAQRLAETW
jgi:hypothetical protein